LALTSPTCGGRSVGIVRLRTKATEFSFFLNNFRIPDNELIGSLRDMFRPLYDHPPD
jgi:hypothetical protein